MGKKALTPPTSKAPETAAVDDSWDDLVFSALGERPEPREDLPEDIFERATAIPDSPPGGLGEFEPDPGGRAPNPLRGPGNSAYSPAEVLKRRRTEEALELDLGDRSTPLDLASIRGRDAEGRPALAAPESNAPPGEPGKERGNRNDMQDRYAVGDFTGALVVAESILDAEPDNEDAKRYAHSCREVLTQMYAARLGPMDQVPSVVVPADQITWLSLDHRAGFLLSLVDGVSNIEEILDVSGMTRLDALRIMYTLAQQNVIALSR